MQAQAAKGRRTEIPSPRVAPFSSGYLIRDTAGQPYPAGAQSC
jgi:hypothetical protein